MNPFLKMYGWVRRALVLVWLCFLILVGAKLTQQNPQLIQLDLLFWTTPAIAVGVILGLTLLTGILLGIAVMLPSLLLTQSQLRRQKKYALKAFRAQTAPAESSLLEIKR